jgi:glycosyltransferase involved in cell wall biosynthesis
MPRVSVVMAVYNEERYIGEALDSILAQHFADFEFIVVDDGSTDRTVEILKGCNDPRLKVFRQSNSGQSLALNQGIKLAWGPYIARMDGDDVSLPDRLAKEVRFLDSHPEVGLVGTWCLKIDESSGKRRLQSLPETDAAIRRFMLRDNPFIHSSVMVRKDALDRVGLYDRSFVWQDYDLWVRIARFYRLANIGEPLILRRKHPASMTRTTPKSKEFWDLFRIQWRAARHLEFRGAGLAGMGLSLGRAAWYRVCGV